jgi:signal transduction histidine kinase
MSVRRLPSAADEGLVAVQDARVGFNPQRMARRFDALCTSKTAGMSFGQSICRTIIEAHGGRLWASPNDGPGATMLFTLPIGSAQA